MTTTININDTVICTLTKKGLGCFCKHYNDLGLNPDEYLKVYNRNLPENQIRMTLWTLMRIFGNQMYMGNNEQMFVENKLVVEKVC